MVSAIAESILDAPRTAAFSSPAGTSVKLLDLLTNRYHAGVLRHATTASLRVEVAATSRIRAGPRVRCILASPSAGVLARGQMRRASVLHVESPTGAPRLLLELAFMDDPTAS